MASKKLTCFACAQVNRLPEERLTEAAKCGTCGAKLITGKVAEVDLATLQKAARHDDLPLVVDFWAPWCGPCRQMAPQFQQAAGTLKAQARLVKLDTQEHPKASQIYGIRGIPMLARFAGGREQARQAGVMPAPAIINWVMRG
ncbi:thioredoxin TrxC [Cognatishimia sp. SS12]|uniref:thioredoxin TrxC n=1 Tax=Cognatishimia sp. SS12 TaxID=2979465 RepID=UPI00232B9DBB|nr:thioredoxin TrxC [Cognatishimia sp. SS12]MDC0738889.1 thioredoxin TrxC [Cognatishimia sp. SS12]